MAAQSNYERYVERYAQKHEITKEQAKDHYLVKSAKEYYDEKERIGEDGK